MTPTMELRFVERQITEPIPNSPGFGVLKNVHILQQKWVGEEPNSMTGKYTLMQEWRDVPVTKEGA